MEEENEHPLRQPQIKAYETEERREDERDFQFNELIVSKTKHVACRYMQMAVGGECG